MISCSELNFEKDQNENLSRSGIPFRLGQDPTRFSLAIKTLSSVAYKSTKGQVSSKTSGENAQLPFTDWSDSGD